MRPSENESYLAAVSKELVYGHDSVRPLCGSHSFIEVHSMHAPPLPSFAMYFNHCSALQGLWIVMEWLDSCGGTLGNANGKSHAENKPPISTVSKCHPLTIMLLQTLG